MKTKLFLAVAFFMFSLTMSYASFPVLRTKKAVVKTEIQTNLTDNSAEIYDTSTVDSEEYVAAAAKKQGKDKWVGVALWFFLGWPFAAHPVRRLFPHRHWHRASGWCGAFPLTGSR